MSQEERQKLLEAQKDLVDNLVQSWPDLIDFHGITDQDVKEIIYHNDENGKRVLPVHTQSDPARAAIIKLYTYESPLYKTLNQATFH